MQLPFVGRSIRVLVLGAFLAAMYAPLALSCTINLPPGTWKCYCDADCACVCVQL